MTTPNLPPLPKKRRAFICTKCGSQECKAGEEALMHPPCAKCDYLGFAQDCDYNDAEVQAYALEALRLASPQGWISVEERLPAINELVFGVAAGGALSVFSRDDGGGDGWLWSRQMWAWNIAAPDGIEADDDYDVRFWRPMFELPAPEATKGNS